MSLTSDRWCTYGSALEKKLGLFTEPFFFFFFCYCQVKRTTHIRVSQVDICADITSWLLTTILQNHAGIIHIHTTIFFFLSELSYPYARANAFSWGA